MRAAEQGPRAELEGCTGTHIPSVVGSPERFTWYPVAHPEPVRGLEHTCSRHDGPAYELCLAGGAYLIRRTIGSETWDTARVNRRAVAEWWRALLAGWAV